MIKPSKDGLPLILICSCTAMMPAYWELSARFRPHRVFVSHIVSLLPGLPFSSRSRPAIIRNGNDGVAVLIRGLPLIMIESTAIKDARQYPPKPEILALSL